MTDDIPFVIPAIIYALIEEDNTRNKMRLYRRNLRDNQNPFEVLSERDYSKNLAQMLINRVEPYLINLRSIAIPGYLKVLATLNLLGHGSYQHIVRLSSVTALSQPVISRAISLICKIITTHLMPEWIQFPTTAEDMEKTKQCFLVKFGFRGVLGCIDGTHVEIIAPKVTNLNHLPYLYINRKCYHSINVMLICDSNCSILACVARYPESLHNSAIWRTSDIRNHMRMKYENGDIRSRLIGDSRYGLEPWLFTPFARMVNGTPKANFNNLLTSTRNCVERTNGILKGRFRCLLRHRVLHYSPDNASYIIYAAAVLHNIAISVNLLNDEDVLEGLADEVIRQPEVLYDQLLQLGREARAEYIRMYV